MTVFIYNCYYRHSGRRVAILQCPVRAILCVRQNYCSTSGAISRYVHFGEFLLSLSINADIGDTGWEIFSLDYAVDAPLTALIHDDALATYRTAFHMLWRLKRVEWSLSAAWKAQMSFGHIQREVLSGLRPVLHRCGLHRSRMRHFVNNLSAYLMFEVMESAWSSLQSSITGAASLDEVILAHDRYLGEIQDRALLSSQHEVLNIQIQQVLQSILRFCSLEDTLIADAHSILSRRQAMQRDAADRSAAGGWGSTGYFPEDGPDTVDGVSIHVINRLDDAAANYDVQFGGLMKMLREKVGCF